MSTRLELALGILNGLVGSHLERTGNPLATAMGLYLDGRAVAAQRDALRAAYPDATARVVMLVHGLMALEHHFAYDGTDYGRQLARDHAMTPVYVRYNSGQRIAQSGAQLSVLLGELVDAWPVPIEELIFIGHSMGGLVVRAACHSADRARAAWLGHVRRAFYLGTPHRGVPLERVGRAVARTLRAVGDPYARLVADLADLRSDGVRDLGDARHPVPLLPSIRHHLVAGTLSTRPLLAELLGDSLVPISSATHGAVDPADVAILAVSHNLLARHPLVYAELKRWLS